MEWGVAYPQAYPQPRGTRTRTHSTRPALRPAPRAPRPVPPSHSTRSTPATPRCAAPPYSPPLACLQPAQGGHAELHAAAQLGALRGHGELGGAQRHAQRHRAGHLPRQAHHLPCARGREGLRGGCEGLWAAFVRGCEGLRGRGCTLIEEHLLRQVRGWHQDDRPHRAWPGDARRVSKQFGRGEDLRGLSMAAHLAESCRSPPRPRRSAGAKGRGRRASCPSQKAGQERGPRLSPAP